MAKTRMTLDYSGSQIRAFNNWLSIKLRERDEKTHRKKYRQTDVAEYIGIQQGELSNKMCGRGSWSLKQVLDVCDYFDESPRNIFL